MNVVSAKSSATDRQRARFETVRHRVFLEMRHLASRWRFALTVPFQLLVVVMLALRDFPRDRLLIQITAFVAYLVGSALTDRLAARTAKLAVVVSGLGMLVSIANTGGLASPLMLSAVPFLVGTALNPLLEPRRRYVLALHLATFAGLAIFSRYLPCLVAQVPEGERVIASSEYALIALGSGSLTLIALYHMGRGITGAYERIALELVETREEICNENEGRTRALEGIAARLAHEVKNPLAAIKGLSTHVARSAADPKVKERLTIVAAEAERLQEIVDGFLSFSRGLDDLSLGPVKPYEIAHDLATLLETRANDAGVTLHVAGSRELTVNADGKKLRQVLLNLVLNAMQASPAGGEITMEIAMSCADGAAVLRVRDHGAGMTPDVVARIQKPYFTTKEGGSGLGIAVARGIVEQHGGSLGFESSPGHGTTATIVLPACAKDAQRARGHQALPNPCRMHGSKVDDAEAPAEAPVPAFALAEKA